MSVRRLPILDRRRVLQMGVEHQRPTERWNGRQGACQYNRRQPEGHVEFRGPDFKAAGLVLEVSQDSLPVVIDMQPDGHQKENPHVDVDIAPLGFVQSQQTPVGPVSHPPLGRDIEDDARDKHENKRGQGR